MFAGLFWLAFWPAVTLLPLGRSPADAVQGKTDTAATKNLTCQSLTVVGPDGRPRAILEGYAQGGRLALYDGRMKCRLSFTLDDSSCPHVSLYDKAFHSRISLGLDRSESPSIHINDSHDKTRAMFWMSDAGSPVLQMMDEKGDNSMQIHLSDAGLPSINLVGRKTKQEVAIKFAEVGGNETPMLTFTDGGGNTAMQAELTQGRPAVTLFGKDAVRSQLAVRSDGAVEFSLADKKSNPVFILKVDKNGSPVVLGDGPKMQGLK